MELVSVSEGGKESEPPAKEPPKLLSRFELWSHIAIYATLGVCVFFFVASIVAYAVFDQNFRERVNAIDDTCSNNDEYADLLAKPPRQELSYFSYNLTNPYDYVRGRTAIFHELGPYGMSLLPVRNNVEFVKSEGTVTFNLYNDITHDPDESCEGCNLDNTIYSPNVPYLALFSNAQNEGSLILSMTCSAAQIALMAKPATSFQPTLTPTLKPTLKPTVSPTLLPTLAPTIINGTDAPSTAPPSVLPTLAPSSSPTIGYCTVGQIGTPTSCICCSPLIPTPSGAIPCANLLTPVTKPAGILSWLAKYDNCWKIRNAVTGFNLISEIYTPLVRRLAVSEVIFGTVSSLLGLLRTTEALRNSDFTTIYENSNTTADLRDACNATCPSLSLVKSRFQQAIATSTPLTTVDYACTGTVPSYEDLIPALGQARALELRYLEGVSCKPFSVTLAINALLLIDTAATKVCADGTTLTGSSSPCCLKSYRSTTFGLNGGGLGCHFWVNGLVQSRRVYSDAEAVAYLKPSPETQFYSGCAEGKLKFQQNIWRGQSHFAGWFTPNNYRYPNMSWADPTVVKTGRAGTPGAGTMIPFKVSGYQAGVRHGVGITSNFGVYQLTNGKPEDKKSDVWAPFKLGVTPLIYEKNRIVDDLETNHFIPDLEHDTDPILIEEKQRHGILPYQNMYNLVYSLNGIPVIMTYPNFYESDAKMLTQSENYERKSKSTSGIQLLRTRDGYSKDSELLSSPEPITTETWEEFGEKNYRGYLDIEPATGLTLEGKVANQLSVYTWNCNPTLDPSCQFIRNTTTNSNCYTNGFFPCSFANVFTPKVMGGKVLPVYWLYTTPGAPTKASGGLTDGVDTRYSLSVLVVFIPITTYLISLALVWCLFHHSNHNSPSQPIPVPTSEK